MKKSTCNASLTGAILTTSLLVSSYIANAQEVGDKYPKPYVSIEEGIKLHDAESYKDAVKKYALVNPNDSFYSNALYEMALSLQKDKQYEQAASVALKGIALNSELDKLFLLNYAAILDEWGKKDSAIKVYDNGLAKYPYAHQFIHEKGVAYAKGKDWDNALKYYTETIKMNPYSSATHWRIGIMAASANKPAIALMALNMYCLMVQDNDAVFNALKVMQKVADNEYTTDEAIDVKHFEFAKDLDEIDLIIQSRAAVQNQYKSVIGLNYSILKQLQVLCEKLPTDYQSGNWLLDFYVNFHKDIWTQKRFEGAALQTFRLLNAKDVQSQVKSKSKAIDAFQVWASDRLNQIRNYKTITVNGKEEKIRLWFEDGYFRAIGNEDANGKNQGYWKIYSENYILTAEGNFVDDEKDGLWKYYYGTGELKQTETYVKGKAEGKTLNYYKNGSLKETDEYKADKLDGELVTYNPNNTLKAKMNVVNDKLDGVREGYNDIGLLSTKETFKAGISEGPYISYHNNGQINLETKTTKDQLNGPAKFFYANGLTKTTGAFANGERDGEWKWYHKNGKIETIGFYTKGKETGTWKHYYDNGNLEKEEFYENGGKKASYKLYDLNGVLYAQMSSKGNNIDAFKYFDESGKVIAESKTQGGKLNFVRYSEYRNKVTEGLINNGFDEGTWKYYYENGALEYEIDYVKGNREGLMTYYYKNGKVNYRVVYRDNERDGYYESFFLNGNKQTTGYYDNGQRVGEWKYYNANGTLNTTEFYIEGEVNGKAEGFTEDGKPIGYALYEYGYFNNYYQADTNGVQYNATKLKFGSGTYELKSPNGKRTFFGKYIGGKRDSIFTTYFGNGKPSIIEQYKFGNNDGFFKRFYENGQLNSVGNYTNDEQDSVWNYFDENGKKTRITNFKGGKYHGAYTSFYNNGKTEIECNYVNDVLDGTYKLYSFEGQLIFEAHYKGGVLKQYTYPGKDGKMVAPILVNNETADIKTYFANGNLALSYSIKNGLRHGKHERYFESGKLHVSTDFVDGNYEGEHKIMSVNATPVKIENYFYDDLNGVCKYYNESGKLIKEVTYLLGVKHGSTKIYDPITGKLTQTINYRYGKSL